MAGLARGIDGMRADSATQLIRDLATALGGGLLSGLIAYYAQPHLALTLGVGAAVCIVIAVGIGHIRRRPRLVLKIQGTPLWKNLNPSFRIIAVRVQAKNKTGATIGLEGFELTDEASGIANGNGQLSDEVACAVARTASSDQYFPPLSGFAEIPAHGSISGWFVAAVRRDPAGGTPRCIFTLEDEIGSRYKATIPAQEAHIWG